MGAKKEGRYVKHNLARIFLSALSDLGMASSRALVILNRDFQDQAPAQFLDVVNWKFIAYKYYVVNYFHPPVYSRK
jgi:hypothetical protein